MNLSLLIILPLVTAIILLFSKGLKQVRSVALFGSVTQLGLCLVLLAEYWKQRSSGNTSQMLFEENYTWFRQLNINYHIGVDGISIAMILLTAFVVVAGVLVSWTVDKLSKEFFFLLIFPSCIPGGMFGNCRHSSFLRIFQ